MSELRELDVKVLENAIFLPGNARGGGVISSEGDYQPSSYTSRCFAEARKYDYEEVLLEHSDEEVICLGIVNPCWGHCLTDSLKFLWVRFSDRHSLRNIKNLKFVYAMQYPNQVLPDNFLGVLSRLGIPETRLVKVTKPTRFKRIYLPEECFWHEPGRGRFFTIEYEHLLDVLTSGLRKGQDRKIYLTRSRWRGRTIDYGETQIAEYFHAIGYEVISPELVPFSEFLSMMANCSVLAATEGSIAHNAVFLRKGARIVLLRKSKWSNDYQRAINVARHLDVLYIDANRTWLVNPKTPWEGPFFLYVSPALRAWGGEVKCMFPYGQYVMYLLEILCMKAFRFMRLVYAQRRNLEKILKRGIV